MDLSGIIAISGKAGLFKVIAQGKNNIIVESLIDKKRTPAYATDRISALEDISIYTYDEDTPLKDLLSAIYKKENGKECPSHKEDISKLQAYLLEILPNYDQERVYSSDVKKMFQWYNLLHKTGNLKQLEAKEEKTEEISKEEVKTSKPKKAAAKASSAAKPTASAAKVKSSKPSTPKKTATTKTGSSRGK